MKSIIFISFLVLTNFSSKLNTFYSSNMIDSYVDQAIDSTIINELEQIAIEDQTLRLLLPDVEKKFGKTSPEAKYIWSLINRQDSICLIKVIEILDEYGWLGKSRVGEKANQAIWLVIQHTDLARQERYLPLLKESVENGESEGWHLAFLEDRILMRQHKKQKYGSQAFWDKEANALKIYPIADIERVNYRREKIGLETVEEYAEMNGYIFDQKR